MPARIPRRGFRQTCNPCRSRSVRRSNRMAPIDVNQAVATILLAFGSGTIAALLLGWHFLRFGSTTGDRHQLARTFPFLLLTTILIVTVVKSSVALSLGLVGALSIVRFRTPIKEP